MRPLKLRMTAFESYLNTTEIDFQQFGKNGIYIIAGKTGSGKTTIFDAITYALYGEPSGDSREVSMLRTKNATPDMKTEVVLEFANGKDVYRVERSPKYKRFKDKGVGTTDEERKANLYLPDGSVVSGYDNVTKRIQSILGVDRKQFSQIVMIAQGDFKKVLFASTAERQAIFREVFKTINYVKLEDAIKKDAINLKKQLDKIKDSITQFIGDIECHEDDVLISQVDKAKAGSLLAEDTLELIEQLIGQDEEAITNLKSKEKSLEEQDKIINITLTKLNDYNKAKTNYETCLKNKEQYQDNLIKAEEDLKLKQAKNSVSDEKKSQIAEIKLKLPDYEKLQTIVNDISGIKKQISEDKVTFDMQKDLLEKTGEKLANFKIELQQIEDVGEKLEKGQNDYKGLVDKKASAEEILSQLSRISDLVCQLKEAQDSYEAAKAEAKEATKLHELKRDAFLAAQAGIMAEKLEEGMPCPVCGSTHHEKKAEKSTDAPTEEELKSLEKDANMKKSVEEEKSKLSGQISVIIKEIKDNVSKQLSQGIDENNLQPEIDGIKTNIKNYSESITELEGTIKGLKETLKRKQQLVELIPTTEKSLRDIEQKCNVLQADIQSREVMLKEKEGQRQIIQDNLRYQTMDEAKNQLVTLEREVSKIQKDIETAIDIRDKAKSNIDTLDGQIRQLEEQLKEKPVVDDVELKKQQKECEVERLNIRKTMDEIQNRIHSNVKARDGITRKGDELAQVESKFIWLDSLSKTANGEITGKDKTKFETFIQMTYFDRILRRANYHLYKISGGQYELKRTAEASKNNGDHGLDLEVVDHHHDGTTRDVKSFSNGETFMASLSLALGLSDEVQSSAGGIMLETMFIDEGFGALDEEVLEKAMDAFKSLAEGNRLVGIISHVNELKQEIPNQIRITKNKLHGSSVEIVVE